VLEVYALHLSRDLAYIVGVAPINSTLCNTFHHLEGARFGSLEGTSMECPAMAALGLLRQLRLQWNSLFALLALVCRAIPP
jgi:hypothetical protein